MFVSKYFLSTFEFIQKQSVVKDGCAWKAATEADFRDWRTFLEIGWTAERENSPELEEIYCARWTISFYCRLPGSVEQLKR
jgi:hypothetical protein